MLIEISEKTHPIILDLKYGSKDNFTHQQIYDHSICLLHQQAIPLFEKAVELAAQQNLRFKVFDAFRPQKAQEKLWDIFPDSPYVADPKKGSNHTRGVAIDLTLIDKNSQELDMGTPFDDFTVQSHHAGGCSPQVNANRYTLLGIMMTADWDFYNVEWWHYQLFDAKSFPLIAEDYGMMTD